MMRDHDAWFATRVFSRMNLLATAVRFNCLAFSRVSCSVPHDPGIYICLSCSILKFPGLETANTPDCVPELSLCVGGAWLVDKGCRRETPTEYLEHKLEVRKRAFHERGMGGRVKHGSLFSITGGTERKPSRDP